MANQKKIAPVLTPAQQTVLDGLPTKSARIRYLAAEGYATGDIARILGIIFQHARNVLNQPLKG
jgi:hypothetical protein